MNHKKFRLAAAAVSTLAIAFLGTGAPAFAADPTPVGGPVAANTALINPDAKASLHLTKYSGGDNGMPADGSEGGAPTDPLNVALPGVTYAIYKVPGVDLTTNTGWATASSYYANVAGAWTALGATPTPTATAITDSNGQVNFSGLELGLYYVMETAAPAGYTMAAPFLVTLPMTDPEGPDNNIAATVDNNTTWMYDVYVYPKNQQDSITKSVVDKGTQTTDETATDGVLANHDLTYTLTSTITDGSLPLGMYVIYDELDESLSLDSLEVKVGEVIMTRGTDYEIYVAESFTTTAKVLGSTDAYAGAGPALTIVFLEDPTPLVDPKVGLSYLEAHRTDSVVTTINANILAQLDGEVPNMASFIPNYDWYQDNMITGNTDPTDPTTYPPTGTGTDLPGLDSNPVTSKYGDLVINKKDAATSALITGAEFTIYLDKDADGNAATTCTVGDLVPEQVINGPVSTTDGVFTFDGLQTSDYYDGASISVAPARPLLQYCLVETKAPTGYNLLAQPVPFTILSTDSGMIKTLNLVNEKTNLNNNLPLTGGEGVAALSLGGLALIGGGLGYYAYTSRKRRTA